LGELIMGFSQSVPLVLFLALGIANFFVNTGVHEGVFSFFLKKVSRVHSLLFFFLFFFVAECQGISEFLSSSMKACFMNAGVSAVALLIFVLSVVKREQSKATCIFFLLLLFFRSCDVFLNRNSVPHWLMYGCCQRCCV
jgi:hypothetical protein